MPEPEQTPSAGKRQWLQNIILVPLLTAIIGFLFTWLQDQRESREANVRIYADLLNKREEADSALRKDMFNSVITKFLRPATEDTDEQILHLELLAYNFHEALDLGPLFKYIHRRISDQHKGTTAQLERLEYAAAEVTAKEARTLAEAGAVEVINVRFDELEEHPEGLVVLDKGLVMKSDLAGDRNATAYEKASKTRRFQVEALKHDTQRREIRFRVHVSPPGRPNEEEIDTWFWVGFFDFPMIDNTRLSEGNRFAVVLNQVEAGFAKATLALFPGSRASLKDKPYYEEVIQDLLRTRDRMDRSRRQ